MVGFIVNIEEKTLTNTYFRQVLYTTKLTQLVVMALLPHEEIGTETHAGHDQFIRIESGNGIAELDGAQTNIKDGSAIVIPAGTKHNIINTSETIMQLYTIYTPPEHRDKTVHKTKTDAQADASDHFEEN